MPLRTDRYRPPVASSIAITTITSASVYAERLRSLARWSTAMSPTPRAIRFVNLPSRVETGRSSNGTRSTAPSRMPMTVALAAGEFVATDLLGGGAERAQRPVDACSFDHGHGQRQIDEEGTDEERDSGEERQERPEDTEELLEPGGDILGVLESDAGDRVAVCVDPR